MRLFDKISTVVLAAACVAAVSCVKDNPKSGTIKAKSYNYFDASPSASDVSADGGTIVLEVNANVSWKLTVAEGLVPDVMEGEGRDSVHIEVPANRSFDPRSFAYSISTEEELDVDDPQKWTEFGKTLNFSVAQAGVLPKFSVDTDSLSVASAAVSVKITLTENVGYEVLCQSEELSCQVEDDPANVFIHYLTFSFPANKTESPVLYRAMITPKSQPTASIQAISLVIRQSAYIQRVLDCTNAGAFRYDNAGTPTAFPMTYHGKDFVTGDFWLKGYEQYIFNGSVKNWGGTLNAAKNSPVLLPSIPGFVLVEVDVTYSMASADRVYKVMDGIKDLGSCTRNASTTTETKIDLSASVSTPGSRYLVCTSEMCLKFRLTYVSIE